MKHFIIITNRPKDPDLEITRRVQELLKLRQASCSVYADEIPKEEWKRILLRRPDGCDFGTGRGRDDAAGGAGYGG